MIAVFHTPKTSIEKYRFNKRTVANLKSYAYIAAVHTNNKYKCICTSSKYKCTYTYNGIRGYVRKGVVGTRTGFGISCAVHPKLPLFIRRLLLQQKVNFSIEIRLKNFNSFSGASKLA